VFALRVRRSARVRRRQRSGAASRSPHSALDTAASVRRSSGPASAAVDAHQGPREPVRSGDLLSADTHIILS